MQSINRMQFIAAALVASGPAFAHDESGWASIHWHASDFLGLAIAGVLAAAAIWLARRQQRASRKKSDDPR